MLDFIRVLILSLVEGVTEFLPVSSTGHLILVNEFVALRPDELANAFNVIIQLGAILAVVVIYFNKLNPFPKSKLEHGRFPKALEEKGTKNRLIKKVFYWFEHNATAMLWLKIIVAVIPSAVLGLIFDDKIEELLFKPIPVALALVVYGVIIIFMERHNAKKETFKFTDVKQLSFKTAFLIGLFQVLAMWPGTSRSAATIIGAMILGLNRTAAAEFSFFLAIPTMVGASLLKIVKTTGVTSYGWSLVALGFVLSFIFAYVVIKKFLDYIKKHDFKVFGYYRLVVGALVFLYFAFL